MRGCLEITKLILRQLLFFFIHPTQNKKILNIQYKLHWIRKYS